jgi:hypothetical protein
MDARSGIGLAAKVCGDQRLGVQVIKLALPACLADLPHARRRGCGPQVD